MRVLTIISGVLLVLTGLFCFANPGETFLSLAFVLGIIMIANSVIQGVAYWQGRRGNKKDNNGWILTEAIITFILGVLVLSYQIAADVAIPMVFGMWVMFSGILRVVTATMIDRENKKLNFAWTLVTGVLCVLGGIYAFLNPIMAGVAIAVLLGIMFLLQGISTLELGIHMPHEKKVKQPKQKKEKKEKKHKKGKAAATKKPEAEPEDIIYQEPVFEAQEPIFEPQESVSEPQEQLFGQQEFLSELKVQEKREEKAGQAQQMEKEDEIATALQKAAAVQKKAAAKTKTTEEEPEEEQDFMNFFKL